MIWWLVTPWAINNKNLSGSQLLIAVLAASWSAQHAFSSSFFFNGLLGSVTEKIFLWLMPFRFFCGVGRAVWVWGGVGRGRIYLNLYIIQNCDSLISKRNSEEWTGPGPLQWFWSRCLERPEAAWSGWSRHARRQRAPHVSCWQSSSSPTCSTTSCSPPLVSTVGSLFWVHRRGRREYKQK